MPSTAVTPRTSFGLVWRPRRAVASARAEARLPARLLPHLIKRVRILADQERTIEQRSAAPTSASRSGSLERTSSRSRSSHAELPIGVGRTKQTRSFAPADRHLTEGQKGRLVARGEDNPRMCRLLRGREPLRPRDIRRGGSRWQPSPAYIRRARSLARGRRSAPIFAGSFQVIWTSPAPNIITSKAAWSAIKPSSTSSNPHVEPLVVAGRCSGEWHHFKCLSRPWTPSSLALLTQRSSMKSLRTAPRGARPT